MIPGDGKVAVENRKSVVKPYVLSHGTLECYSLPSRGGFMRSFSGWNACVMPSRPWCCVAA